MAAPPPQGGAASGPARPVARPPTNVLSRAVDAVDARFLEGLIGYNARRAALSAIALFLERMAVYGLKPVDFSVLSLIAHNPGITSAQLCASLGLLPPNLVGMVAGLEKRNVIVRRPHPRDGRALGLHLTPSGQNMMAQAEATAQALEAEVAARMSPAEARTLIRLLKKVYL